MMNMEILHAAAIRSLFPKRKEDAHKGDFGRLLCITGSRRMPGAACMSAQAALRCGVGLMTVATAAENVPILAAQCWESMYLPLRTDEEGFVTWHGNEVVLSEAAAKADAVLVGCGLGLTEETTYLVQQLVQYTKAALILDADGLNAVTFCIDILAERSAPVILTPHAGEMARILHCSVPEVQRNRIGVLHQACQQFPHGVVVLKGHHTLVGQGGNLVQNPTGNPGMSRGGSGDVLAGMIAAFAAQGMSPFDAAKAGVYLHGLAGDLAAHNLGEISMLPRDLIACIPEAFFRL
jgi:NAD(P)H-hydrate epimerase